MINQKRVFDKVMVVSADLVVYTRVLAVTESFRDALADEYEVHASCAKKRRSREMGNYSCSLRTTF